MEAETLDATNAPAAHVDEEVTKTPQNSLAEPAEKACALAGDTLDGDGGGVGEPNGCDGAELDGCDGTEREDGDSGEQERDGAEESENRRDGEDAQEDDDDDSDLWSEDVFKEHELPPLDLNYDALKHIASYFMPGNHGKCTGVITLTRGAYHEIRELQFEDGWTCIGRFTRNRKEAASVLESETATIKYVSQHTSIPVPEIYFTNTNANHVVGAAFVLMEKLPGRHLYRLWKRLSMDNKFHVVKQVADVVAQLMSLKFPQIGSLNSNGEIGPLQDLAYSHDESGRGGPFDSTLGWFMDFLQPLERRGEDVMAYYAPAEAIITDFLKQQDKNPILKAPYRLIHEDLDGQNILFTQDDPGEPPQLTGVIDWDQARTGPLYYLLEYPIFLQDCDMGPGRFQYANNRVLRQYFVYRLSRYFPDGSYERHDVLECFRQKGHTLNGFHNTFMGPHLGQPEIELMAVRGFVDDHIPGTSRYKDRQPYTGRHDWEADSEWNPSGEEDDDEGDDEDDDEVDDEDGEDDQHGDH